MQIWTTGLTAAIRTFPKAAAMPRFAGRVIKKYGDSGIAYQCFMEEAEKCEPTLEQMELQTIWRSAQKFYAKA